MLAKLQERALDGCIGKEHHLTFSGVGFYTAAIQTFFNQRWSGTSEDTDLKANLKRTGGFKL
jgi:hypothetical protein